MAWGFVILAFIGCLFLGFVAGEMYNDSRDPDDDGWDGDDEGDKL